MWCHGASRQCASELQSQPQNDFVQILEGVSPLSKLWLPGRVVRVCSLSAWRAPQEELVRGVPGSGARDRTWMVDRWSIGLSYFHQTLRIH